MDTKIIRGNLLGAPISANYVSINDADIGALLKTASGLAKTLFVVGAAAGIIQTLLHIYANVEIKEESEEERIKREESEKKEKAGQELIPWGTLVQVVSWRPKGLRKINRKFCGTCLNETVTIACDSHNLIIPISQIRGYQNSIKEHFKLFSLRRHFYHEAKITLFDGSIYRGKIESPEKFDFLTPIGNQSILINDLLTETCIKNVVVKDVELLRVNMIKFIEENHKKLEDYLGKENLEHFFLT